MAASLAGFRHGVSRSTGKHNSTPASPGLTSGSMQVVTMVLPLSRIRAIRHGTSINPGIWVTRFRRRSSDGRIAPGFSPETEKPSIRMAFLRDGQSLASLKSPEPVEWPGTFGIPAWSGLEGPALFDRNPYQYWPLYEVRLRRWRQRKLQFSCRYLCPVKSAI
jgi:hypothetical protein